MKSNDTFYQIKKLNQITPMSFILQNKFVKSNGNAKESCKINTKEAALVLPEKMN